MKKLFLSKLASIVVILGLITTVFAKGHSPLCAIIDNGGGWYKEKEIYAFGERQKFINDMKFLPKDGKPISVQINLEMQNPEAAADPVKVYRAALRDVKENAPNKSILTINGYGYATPPEITLRKLDVVPNKIIIIHDIPPDIKKANVIHGTEATKKAPPAYFQELNSLRTRFSTLQNDSSGRVQVIDLNEVELQKNANLKTFVENKITSAKDDELIIIIGHNEYILTERYLKFHDESKLLVDLAKSKANVWNVTCSIYESRLLDLDKLQGPTFVTLDTFGYNTAYKLAKIPASTKGSIREMIIKIQEEKLTVPKPPPPTSPKGSTQKTGDLDVFTLISRNDNSLQFDNVIPSETNQTVTAMIITEKINEK